MLEPKVPAWSMVLILAALAPAPAQNQEIVDTYVDGTLRARYSVNAQGEKVGPYLRYHHNGKLRIRASYQKNQRGGRYEEFHRTGLRKLSTTYRQGKLHGEFQQWSRDGKRVLTANYREGQLHGDFGITLEGEVLTRQHWKKGKLQWLNGIAPYPRPLGAQRAEVLRILKAPKTIEGVDQDPKLPRRLAALRRLQAYRFLCGLPYREMSLNPAWNELCDAGSEILKRIGRLDHTPPKPKGMDEELYRKGYQGTSHSNLSAGSGMVRSVDSYMNDSDPKNIARLGHRRWCLNPSMRRTGFGEAARYSAMWSFDNSGPGVSGMEAVFYPPKGFVPVDFFGPRHAFSISIIRGGVAKKENLVIKITPLDAEYVPSGKPLELDYLDAVSSGPAIRNCLIFRPTGLQVEPGKRYWVEVSCDAGKTQRYEYLLEFVPAIAGRAGPTFPR